VKDHDGQQLGAAHYFSCEIECNGNHREEA
jgi:hypothetical protein